MKVGFGKFLAKKGVISDDSIPSLTKVHEVFKKWLHIEDTDTIDIVLATALSRELTGTPIWLIVVGASGCGKTEIAISIYDKETVELVHQFTPNTLVSGRTYYDKEGNPIPNDLAPKLNGKIMLIPDMAQLLQLHPNQKAEIWAQLRDLFDGYAGKKTGSGTDKQYCGLRITLLACSTPAIDSQIMIHQDLGSRELIWRTKGIKEEQDLMKKAWYNENYEEEMKKELSTTVQSFLKEVGVKKLEISEEVTNDLMNKAELLTYLRAAASFDKYKNELISDVTPEKPTRVLKQFKRLYICLKSLSDDYSDEQALKIIEHLVYSCAEPNRLKVFQLLLDNPEEEYTISILSRMLKLGKSTIQRQLWVLFNLGLIKSSIQNRETINEYYSYKINLKHKLLSIYVHKKQKERIRENNNNIHYVIVGHLKTLINKGINSELELCKWLEANKISTVSETKETLNLMLKEGLISEFKAGYYGIIKGAN